MRAFANSRPRLLFLACLALAGYFAYTAVTGAIRNHEIAEDRQAVEQELALLTQKKAYLEAVKEYVSSDAYVEQEARRQLGYVRDGEVAFAVISPPMQEDPTQPAEDWWQRLFPW